MDLADRPGLLSVLALAVLVSAGCRRFTKAGADREVYGILDVYGPSVPEVAGSLRVDAADRVAQATRRGESYRLTLEDALALAAAASREYRTERESVYLSALDLTGARNRFHPLFGASGTGEILARHSKDGLGTQGVRGRGEVDADVSRAFETGGGIVLALASDFLRRLASGRPFELAQTILSADLLLPLARGSGWVARENLTQAERDTLYAMRSFARFQQEFTVDIAAHFYRLLQLRDTWRNQERSYRSLERLLERQEALGAAGAGRIPDFEVDQTRQDLLQTDERRVLARAAFASTVDAFKLRLGIPIETDVDIPDDDLEILQQRGLVGPPYADQEAVALAMRRRLDLDNARDEEEDAWRRVLVAKNGLGPQVDLRLGGTLRTLETRPLDLSDTAVEGLFGLDIDLPLERTAERNAYRTALIQAARARRLRQGLEDGIVLQVRDAYRRLERGRQSHEIQWAGVQLAERRVESTDLLLEAGKASTRDRLDAEDALVRARNALTLALVDHAVTRLELERDVGTLQVRADASWVQVPPLASPPAPE